MQQQFKIAIRKLVLKPTFSLVTFVGFTLGIGAALLIYIWVLNELSYEKFHPDYDQIYRVITLSKQGEGTLRSAGCGTAVPKSLKQDYPQIEYATYLSFGSEDAPIHCEEDGEKIEARPLWVSNDFFSIFKGFVFIEGTALESIKNPSGIILNETIAKKLFGDKPALGKTIISDKYTKEVYTITGVVRIPKQSHIDFGYIFTELNPNVAMYANSWSRSSHVHGYVKVRKNASFNRQTLNEIQNHISRYSNNSYKLLFQPLIDIHLHSDYNIDVHDKYISNYKYIWIFSGVALLIVLMTALNFSILSVARASERLTEIGIKKANGAGRFHIIKQFMGESMLHTFAATIVALLLIWLILPSFSTLFEQQLSMQFSFRFFLYLFILILLLGIIAGLYPSFYLSSLNPMIVFRGGSITGSKTGFVRLLVVSQFSIAIFLFVATFLFVKQLDYIRDKNLGFDDKNIVVISTGLWYKNEAFKAELLRNPNIKGVSASVYAPVDFGWERTFKYNHRGLVDSLQISMIHVDEDFADTYRLEIVKGQFLKMDFNAYWEEKKKKEKNTPLVINETAEKLMGFDNPIGQQLGDNVIVGVVKDFHFRPLHFPIGPVILCYNPENIMTMNIRIAPENRTETLKYIRDTYQKNRNGRSFSYTFFDDILAEKYRDETNLQNLTILFSFLSIIISVLGILGMAVFSIDRRIKEIGIRKISGARVSEILTLLNRDFVKWVAIAFVIATPIAYYAMNKWLESFAYKTELSWWIFALAGLLALGIALLTVSWQSWKAATRNPVEALRYE